MEQKGKILVVDDNEDILFALNLLLKPLVEDVRVTKNPEQIDRLYDLLQPDVVLLDMNFRRDAISGEEGFEWLEHILHHDAQAVVILMTAYADTDKAVRAMKSGATDFITKPWNNSKLLATLFAGIELSRERRKRRLLEQRMEVVASPFGAIAAPVIIGEYATFTTWPQNIDYYNTDRKVALYAMDYMVKKAKEAGIGTFYWMGLSDGVSRSRRIRTDWASRRRRNRRLVLPS